MLILLKELWRSLQYRPEFVGCILFFAMMMMQPINEQYYYKVYSKKHGLEYHFENKKAGCPNDTGTDNNVTRLMHEVQADVSRFVTRQSLVQSLPPMITLLFYGPMSDRFGRKPFMILPTCGFLLLMLCLVVIELTGISILWYNVAGFIAGCTGFLAGSVSPILSYLTDIVPKEKLAMRFAVIDLIIFFSIAISNMLSGIILNSFGFLYTFVFMAACFLASILLMIFQLKESLPKEKRTKQEYHWIKSPKRIYKLLKVPRSQKWRLKMLLSIDALSFLSGQVVIGPILLLRLLNSPFCWGSQGIGFFRGTYFFISGVGAVFSVKVFPKIFHKAFVILISNLSSFGYLVLLGSFETMTWYYIAIVVGIFSFSTPAMTRSMLGNQVKEHERGALYAFVSAMQSLVQTIATFTYQKIYRLADEKGKPQAVFIAIAFALAFPFILAFIYMMRDIAYERKDRKRKAENSNGERTADQKSLHDAKENDPLIS